MSASGFAARSVAYIGALNFVAQIGDRGLAFAQVALVAALFGVGTPADQYFLASVVPLTIGFVLGEPFNRAFLTLLVRTRDRAEGTALAAAGLILCSLTLIIATLTYVVCVIVVVPAASPAGSPDLAPWLVFALTGPAMGLSLYFGAILLWLERYAWAAVRLPLTSCASLTAAAVLAAWTHPSVAELVAAVTGGYVFAGFALYLVVAWSLGAAWPARVTRAALRNALASHRRLAGPMVGGVVGGQVIVLMERLFAAPLGPGAVASISYARGLAGAPAAVGVAVGAGSYPAIVRAEAARSRDYLLGALVRGLRVSAALGAALSIFIAMYADGIVQVLFERGSFTDASSERVSRLLIAFALSTLAANLVGFLAQVLYGLDRFTALFYAQGVVFVAYIVLAPGLRAWAGLTGLAVAFSLAQSAGAVLSYVLAARAIGADRHVLHEQVLAPLLRYVGPVAVALGAYRLITDAVGMAPLPTVVSAAAILVLVAGGSIAASSAPEGRRLRGMARTAFARSGR
jgi:putative peptidoglycan lipid II flippase